MPDYRFIDKVSAAANLTANALVVGDDGAKGIKALALGAANLKLFMNAAGTANEYASGITITTFTRDTATASGDQAITGVGFKPSNAIFIATVNDSAGRMSIGLDNGTAKLTMIDYYNTTANTYYIVNTKSIYIDDGAGVRYSGLISALGADGCTITWTREGEPTGTITVAAIFFR